MSQQRGRPKGPTYPGDHQILAVVADARLADPMIPIAKAARNAGVSGESNFKRIRRHYNANEEQLLQSARNRSQASKPTERVRARSTPVWSRDPLKKQRNLEGLSNPLGPNLHGLLAFRDHLEKRREVLRSLERLANPLGLHLSHQLAFRDLVEKQHEVLSNVRRLMNPLRLP